MGFVLQLKDTFKYIQGCFEIMKDMGIHIICTLQCLKVIGTPSINVTSLCIPSNKHEAQAILQECCELWRKYIKYDCPLLIAGQFSIELYRKDLDSQLKEMQFKVPEYHLPVYRLLHPYLRKPLTFRKNFCVYSNSTITSTRITLFDVYSEMIEPRPNLVTGPGNYNIDYKLGYTDFPNIHDQAAKHDPLRATMIVNYDDNYKEDDDDKSYDDA